MYDDQPGPFFLANFHVYVEWKEIRVVDTSASVKAKLFIIFVISRVPRSLVPAQIGNRGLPVLKQLY